MRPTGARRSGDEYQDLVAAEAMLKILKYPSRYEWVKLEVREAGKLDDVLVRQQDGVLEATQVKYSTDPLRPGDPWTWEKLLDKSNRRKSLIQDWCESVKKLEQSYCRVEPRLFSNRRCGDGFYVGHDGLIEVDLTDPGILDEIRTQLGEDTDDFLSRFRFQVDEQDLDGYDGRLLREFHRLGGLEIGWLGLKDAIRSWIRCDRVPENGEIRLKDIREACRWYRLSSLSQNFEVPPDYTLPPDFHEKFLEQIVQCDGSTIVLTASPGAGKSTYLSYLVRELKDKDHPVVRHHYALQSPITPSERFRARRVAESLMANMQDELSGYLGYLTNDNPDPTRLRSWITQVGQQLRETEKSLVVVVDGLDHVWRADDSKQQLSEFFDQLIPVPEGIVLVVGTQTVSDCQLPVSLLSVAPTEQWVTLPGLDSSAIQGWLDLRYQLKGSKPPSSRNQFHLAEVAESLHTKTDGHPLLLRYVVEQIEGSHEQLSVSAVNSISEEFGGSVEKYYRYLWLNLTEEARDCVLLLAQADFPWPSGALEKCLLLAGYERSSTLNALSSIRHLLGQDALGRQAFHNSLLVFAKQHPEFADREAHLRDAVIKWLETDAPEYLRTSHLWMLKSEAGDDESLLSGTDRQWVVEALASGHPPSELARVLQTAAWRAIEKGDFPTYVDRGILADYVAAIKHQDEATRWMFATQLQIGTDDYLEARSIAGMDQISDSHLLEFAKHLHASDENAELASDENAELENCIREFHQRKQRGFYDITGSIEGDGWQLLTPELVEITDISARYFVNGLRNCLPEDEWEAIVERWTSGLRRTGKVYPAIEALDHDLGSDVRRCLSRHVLLQSVTEAIKVSSTVQAKMDPMYGALYLLFHIREVPGYLLEEPTAPEITFSFSSGDVLSQISRYVHHLFFFLVASEIHSPGLTERWEPAPQMESWLGTCLTRLAGGAKRVAEARLNDARIPVAAAYDATHLLDHPPLDQSVVPNWRSLALRIALQTITEDLLAFMSAAGGASELNSEELKSIASHRFTGSRQVVAWIADGVFDVSSSTLENFCTSMDAELASFVESFSDRAEIYALLSNICARHGLVDKAEKYLLTAAENLIGYGYHKDLILHTGLRAIAATATVSDVERSWWCRLAPGVAAIQEFTDGDETRYLPAQLGAVLLRFDPHLAVEYVRTLVSSGRGIEVGLLMDQMIRYGDLAEPAANSLFSTCIKASSIRTLEQLASGGDELADDILWCLPDNSSGTSDTGTASTNQLGRNSLPAEDESLDQDWYLDYPPEMLEKFVMDISRLPPYKRNDKFGLWLQLWLESERAIEALEVVEPYILEDERFSVSNDVLVAVRNVGGRSRSFRWLVKAQRTNSGWMMFWSSFDETRERWDMLKNDYPEKWHDFLLESIKPTLGSSHWFGGIIAHLIEYLIYVGRIEDARATTNQLVETISQLTSGQDLPSPEWTKKRGWTLMGWFRSCFGVRTKWL